MNKLSIALLATLFLFACSKPNNEEKTADAEETQVSGYSYQRAFTKLEWTAYKTSAKVGVKGSFDEINVTPGKEVGTPKEVMDQLEFSIPVSTTNSGNEERDPKIIESFFGAMMNTDNITGKITSINGDESKGKAMILIQMNNEAHEVEGTYAVNGNEIQLDATLQLADWKAEPSVASLNEVCSDLHKGEDGESILWPDVDIHITSQLRPVNMASNN
jgi:hypothetical protein